MGERGVRVHPLVVVLPLIAWHARRHGHGWRVVIVRAIFCCWIAAVVAVALFPLPLPPYNSPDLGADYRGWPYPWISPVPFATIRSSIGQGWSIPAGRFLVGNVGAFVPLGVLVPMLSMSWRTWRRAIVLGIAASLAVEMTQLVLSLAMGFPWRIADVDDVILNALGTLVGFGGWRVGQAVVRASPSPPSVTGSSGVRSRD